MHGRRPFAILAVAALAAIAACTGGSPSERTNDRGAAAGAKSAAQVWKAAADPDAPSPAPEVPDARRGGTLTVLSATSPHTFDPTQAYYLDTNAILTLVTRTLTQNRFVDGKPVLVPDLATDLGRPNRDFTEWEFTLRDGIKYEDGNSVTADDMAYAIKRQFAQDELAGGPTYGLDYFLEGDVYKGPFQDGDDFAGVEVLDDKTFVIKMRKPFPSLRYYASLPAFTPIPQAKDTKEDYGNHPLATGPYKFDEYTLEKELVLVRNDQWDPKTDPNRHQYVDGFDFKFGQDDVLLQKRIIADRDVDQTALSYNELLAENYAEIRGTEAEERLVSGPSPCVWYTYLDTRKIPLPVRRAIAKAWPLASVNKVRGDIPGLTWRPATTIMPSNIPGHTTHDAIGNKGKGDGNPKAAKRILRNAGQVGFELSYHFASNDPIEPKVSTVLKERLEAAGFTVKPIPAPQEKVRELRESASTPVNIRSFSGWCADWANGDSVIPPILDGKKANLPGAPVQSFLNVKEVNDEIDRISRLSPEKSLAGWGGLDALIMDKYLPLIPTGEIGTTLLHGSKVGNVQIDSVLANADFTQIYIKP